jgi:hypothetical protein
MEIEDHLFRHEAGRMGATLTRIFGVLKPRGAAFVCAMRKCRTILTTQLLYRQ